MTLEWSSYQLAVFQAVADDKELIVKARSGSAKTTTIVESLKQIPRSQSTMLVAFNTAIANKLSREAPPGVEVRTLHSYGKRAVQRVYPNVKVDTKRVRTRSISRSLYGRLPYGMETGLAKTVGVCKNTLVSEPEDVLRAIHQFGIDTGITPTERAYEEPVFAKRVSEILEVSKQVDDLIDFDDMIWLPVVLNLRPFQFDRIFCDEAHDINNAQQALVELGLGDRGRLCAVGDDRQAIYQWRGANSQLLTPYDGVTTLPLPICYRCPTRVVELAQTIVPDIQAWEHSPEGEVHRITQDQIPDIASPGDLILSRTNAPLMVMWKELTRLGKPARILGIDLGRGLISFVKASKTTTTEELRSYVDDWLEGEFMALGKAKEPVDEVLDRASVLKHLCEGLGTVDEVVGRINGIFRPTVNSERVTLSSVHKSKGLEFPRVFLLLKTFCRRQKREEANILYVAVTRAQRALFLAEEEGDWERCFR